MTTLDHTSEQSVLFSRKIDDLLLDVRGLVLVRDLLTARGATAGEIEAHQNELERRRQKLVDLLAAA
jgi:hypothetical protein